MASSALGRAPTRSNDELFRYTFGERDTDPDRDDHLIVCYGLIAVFALEDGLKVVGHAGDGEEACLLDKQLYPDILILDLRIPKKAGIEVVIELMPQKPRPRIIVLTHSAKE